jgi:integrase/recombinase XerD
MEPTMGDMQNIPLDSSLEAVLQAYEHHCRQVSGLASVTCANRLRWARSFVSDLSAAGPVALAQLSATAVLGYLGRASTDCSSQVLPGFISGLRCFLRFLQLQELTPMGLDQVLLTVARPATDPPPKHLSPEQQDQLLHAVDRRTAGGRRDYAILLCLARLGLRAGEIARVTLEDVDWQQGTLSLHQTKGRRARSLPLPADVGEAWVGYLQRGRPPTVLREVFVSGHPIPRLMSAGSVSKLVTRAVIRAGLSLPSRGAHLFGHTVATQLIQQGASFKAVADLLGHRQIATTSRYAKVNRPMLAAVAQPWPEVHS